MDRVAKRGSVRIMQNFSRLSSLIVLLAAACGPAPGTDAGPPDAGTNPLFGTWSAQITTGAESQTGTFTFRADRTYTFVHTQMNAAAAIDHAGCLQTDTDVGTITYDATAVTITPNVSMSMVSYANCLNTADNGSMLSGS